MPIQDLIMAGNTWDSIVIGGGIVGSWTGYHLAKSGLKTLILEQFQLPHTRGSSSGQSRLMLMGHMHKLHGILSTPAKNLWNRLAKETNSTLLRETGVLYVENKNERGALHSLTSHMVQDNLPHSKLTITDLNRKYPHYHFDDQHEAVLDETSGLLFSSRCLTLVQEEFKKKGGTIHDGEKVISIIPGSVNTVITSKGTYYCKQLIVSVGPWSHDLLSMIGLDVPVKTMPGLFLYFKVRDPSNTSFDMDSGSPPLVYTIHDNSNKYCYVGLFPCVEYPGMVKMLTRGEPPSHYCHPDERDFKDSVEMIDTVAQYTKEHLPDLDPVPMIKEPCMYSMTPDNTFILDRHPHYRNILIGVGMSGNGFMLAPIIGQLLMELATNQTPSHDVTEARLNRFSTVAKL